MGDLPKLELTSRMFPEKFPSRTTNTSNSSRSELWMRRFTKRTCTSPSKSTSPGGPLKTRRPVWSRWPRRRRKWPSWELQDSEKSPNSSSESESPKSLRAPLTNCLRKPTCLSWLALASSCLSCKLVSVPRLSVISPPTLVAPLALRTLSVPSLLSLWVLPCLTLSPQKSPPSRTSTQIRLSETSPVPTVSTFSSVLVLRGPWPRFTTGLKDPFSRFPPDLSDSVSPSSVSSLSSLSSFLSSVVILRLLEASWAVPRRARKSRPIASSDSGSPTSSFRPSSNIVTSQASKRFHCWSYVEEISKCHKPIISVTSKCHKSAIDVTSKCHKPIINVSSIYQQCHKYVTSAWRQSGITKTKLDTSCQKRPRTTCLSLSLSLSPSLSLSLSCNGYPQVQRDAVYNIISAPTSLKNQPPPPPPPPLLHSVQRPGENCSVIISCLSLSHLLFRIDSVVDCAFVSSQRRINTSMDFDDIE